MPLIVHPADHAGKPPPANFILASGTSIEYDQGIVPNIAVRDARILAMVHRHWIGLLVAVLVWESRLEAQVPKAQPVAATPVKEAPRYDVRRDHDPDGIGKFYMGREIAQVMGHLGAGWLERPEREREEQPRKLMAALKLKPGDVVADIGAGSGYFTFPMAQKVGAKGKVLAVDIQPEMLDIIRKRMKVAKLTNIEPVQGEEKNPKLPDAGVDVILMVDVYHEFSFPFEMTEAMVKALKPGGRLVFVEYRMEDPRVPIKLVHKMTEKQVIKEMKPHPVRWLETIGTLPRQHIIVFEKPSEGSEKKDEKK